MGAEAHVGQHDVPDDPAAVLGDQRELGYVAFAGADPVDQAHLGVAVVVEGGRDDRVHGVEVRGRLGTDAHGGERTKLAGVHETDEDLQSLREVLERSYAGAGPHLRSIHTDNWRLSAEQVVEKLTGMRVLALATVSAKGEPITGPVDGLFYRGRFWFGSSPESVRARHIRRNHAVSATHSVGEELAVVVHGRAFELDKSTERARGFRGYLAEIYGEGTMDQHWEGGAPYWEIEPRKMFALAPTF